MFEAETPAGRQFDIALLILILVSIAVVAIESTPLGPRHPTLFAVLEWVFTVVFTIEYVLRLLCVRRPLGYALSFYGVVDLLAVLPTYIGLFLGTPSLVVIRMLRFIRVLRLFKLTRFLSEANSLMAALRASRAKITVFLGAVGMVVVIVGTVMYLVESEADSGFDSIPKSMYWAIVTMTTVGYGDIAPKTSFGQLIAAMLMIAGYGIIAVPTGIVSAELVRPSSPEETSTRVCPDCSTEGHHPDAKFCRECGADLSDEVEDEPSPGVFADPDPPLPPTPAEPAPAPASAPAPDDVSS
ncbi:MAG: ion transporter [Myxococcales bacterium]|nr:ion transporter [Myxococcales bacterium]